MKYLAKLAWLGYHYMDLCSQRGITTGVTQGLVLGPALCMVMYDGILSVSMTEKASMVAFVDDVALENVKRLLKITACKTNASSS